jgi:hypothetical protein
MLVITITICRFSRLQYLLIVKPNLLKKLCCYFRFGCSKGNARLVYYQDPAFHSDFGQLVNTAKGIVAFFTSASIKCKGKKERRICLKYTIYNKNYLDALSTITLSLLI